MSQSDASFVPCRVQEETPRGVWRTLKQTPRSTAGPPSARRETPSLLKWMAGWHPKWTDGFYWTKKCGGICLWQPLRVHNGNHDWHFFLVNRRSRWVMASIAMVVAGDLTSKDSARLRLNHRCYYIYIFLGVIMVYPARMGIETDQTWVLTYGCRGNWKNL